jgi:MFS family permease
MTANLALGAAFNSFLPVLLPAYILSAGGSATDVGVAMAMVGLFALAGPTIGRIAVRYEGYRVLQVLGVLGLSAAFAILALAEGDSFTIVLGAAVLGIGAAALLVINPTFVVAAGFSKEQEARQLTSLQLNLDVGKIFGGGLLGILAGVNMKSENQFWVAAGVLLLLAGVVWAFNAGAARRIVDAARARVEASRARAAAGDDSGPSKISMRTLLLSIFGLFLLAQILATAANIVVSSQFSNIFSEVFSLGDGQISQLVTISGVLGVGLYFVAGVWMKHASPVLVWATGNALRGAGGVLLAILGALGDMPYIAFLVSICCLSRVHRSHGSRRRRALSGSLRWRRPSPPVGSPPVRPWGRRALRSAQALLPISPGSSLCSGWLAA